MLGVPRAVGRGGADGVGRRRGWVEMLLLRARLNARIGRTGLPAPFVAKLWASARRRRCGRVGRQARAAAAPPDRHRVRRARAVRLVFFGATLALGVGGGSAAIARVLRR